MSKELKAALKAAREAIRSKDYKEALKHCKGALKVDKSNYNALVFVGVAAEGLEQPDQALTAYKKAIESDPNQMLAWQGLCGFYEKSGKAEFREDLADAYTNLEKLLESDVVRKFEINMKLAQLQVTLGNIDQALAVYTNTKDSVQEEPEKLSQIWSQIVCLLTQQSTLTLDQTALLEQGFEFLVHRPQSDDEEVGGETLWTNYINFLLQKQRDSVHVKAECLKMTEKFPNSALPLEVLCRIHLDQYAETGDPNEAAELEKLGSVLQKVDGDSRYLLVTESSSLLSQKQYKPASDVLAEGVKVLAEVVGIWVLWAQAQYMLHNIQGVKRSISKARKLLKVDKPKWTANGARLERVLQLLQAKSDVQLSTPASLSTAVDDCKKLLTSESDLDVLQCLGSAYLSQGNLDEAHQVIAELESSGPAAGQLGLKGWYYFLKGDLQAAEESLIKSESSAAQGLYQLSRVYWAQAKDDPAYRNKAFNTLLQAAKQDPYYAPTFLYLGHYYRDIMKDAGRARRCYQKAFDLDPASDEAGSALVDGLVADGEMDIASEILTTATQKAAAGSAKWAWLRLGLNQLKTSEYSMAILSLQAALRADPKDCHAWECLGEAYLSRGSYTAALKSFTKATQLDPEAMYCFYQIATIQQTLAAYPEAITQYESLLQMSPQYVPALKGLGETHLLQARSALARFLHGRAVDHCQVAIQHLTLAASQRSDLSCIWKLLGDACTLLHEVNKEDIKISVPIKLLSVQDQSDKPTSINKQQLLALGARCYGMALKQLPDCAALWHDLGVNYFIQAQNLGLDDNDSKPLVVKATQSLQKAVTLDPSHHSWTALGVVAACTVVDNPALAQHCFIKSVKAEPKNVIAWTNLGALYLKNGHVEQAHEAFKIAQSLEPSYVACWIGQALTAETVGHEDTMDLFRHTTELGNHTEAAVGYASWVMRTLTDKTKMGSPLYKFTIEHMAAVPAASDAMAKYTDRVKMNPLAYNLYGLLLEKQGLYKQAATALQMAVSLLAKCSDEYLRHSQSNYARILCGAGDYEESIIQYKGCSGPLTFEETCGLALALYKAGQYQHSLKVYEEAAAMAESDEDRSHVYAAQGIVAYKDGDEEAAKQHLFKCSQLSPPSVQGLVALCGIGLLQQDVTLATAVLQEIHKLGHLDDHAAQILHLTAQLMALQGNPSMAKAHIQKEVHLRPQLASFWQMLAQYLLHHTPDGTQVAATCGQAAQNLQAHSGQELSNIQSVAALASGLHSRQDSRNNSFSFVQKAVHLYPALVGQWCSLLGAIHAEQVVRAALQQGAPLEHTALPLAAHLMAKVESELSQGEGDRSHLAALHLWTVKQYVITLLSLGRTEQAQQFMQQAMWLYDNDPALKGLSAFLDQNFRGMRVALNQQQTPFLWQLLVEGLRGQGLLGEVEKTVRQWLQASSSRPAKLVPLVILAHLAYSQIMAGQKEDKWCNLLREASQEALKIDPQCTAVHLMQGLVHLAQGIPRQAKHSFEETLTLGRAGSLPVAQTAARKHLLNYFKDKGDEEKIQALRSKAEDDNDKDFMTFYDEVTQTA